MHFDGVRAAEPGDRAPAPGPLRLVQRFVNTVDLEGGPELLPDAAALRDWLAADGLLDAHARVSAAGHARALALREALRRLPAARATPPRGGDPRAPRRPRGPRPRSACDRDHHRGGAPRGPAPGARRRDAARA